MRILIIRPTPNKVNLNTYNLQEIGLAKALVRKGHQCDVMYYSDVDDRTEELDFDNSENRLKILWLHGYGKFYEGIYPTLKNYIDDYDIIQIGGYVGITSCWLNRNAGSKVINYQGPYYFEGNRGDIRKAFIWDHVLLPFSRKKNMIVATKSILAAEYVKSKGIRNVHTVGVGLDTDNLLARNAETDENPFVLDLVETKGKSRYLLYIGAIEDRRNILFLLDVFKSVKSKKGNVKLVLIGKGKDEYFQDCRNRIADLGISEDVIWKDSLEQKYLPDVYGICDLFLLPTKYEIFGMVLLEAMYFGLPVITSYNGGSSTLMNDGDNGIIINNFNINVWRNKIIELLEDETLYNKISEHAKKTIREGYTWDALADKFMEIYKQRLK